MYVSIKNKNQKVREITPWYQEKREQYYKKKTHTQKKTSRSDLYQLRLGR